MNVHAYALSNAAHFIPIENVPVIAPATHPDDVLDLMRSRHSTMAIVQMAPLTFDILTPQALPQSETGVRIPWGKLGVTVPIQTVSEDHEIGMVKYTLLPSGIYVSSFGLAGVLRDGHLLGLLSSRESGRNMMFFSPPSSYVCAFGHFYSPPPPSHCEMDGSPVVKS